MKKPLSGERGYHILRRPARKRPRTIRLQVLLTTLISPPPPSLHEIAVNKLPTPANLQETTLQCFQNAWCCE
jgi:hypothetical protein